MDIIDKQLLQSRPIDEIEDFDTVASASECTGLIPTPPVNEAQAESYTDIYSIPQPITQKHNHLQQEEGTNNPQNP